jgi:DNA-binding MarR family transcriptional regulator
MRDAIAESLYKLIQSHRSKMKNTATESGISIPISHIRSLKCIKKISNCSASDIAQKLSLDKSQVTRILKELVAEGYVQKRPAPNNHRSQLLVLTEIGNTLLDKLMTLHQQTIEIMTTGLNDQQIIDFINIAETMTNNLSTSNQKN